MLAPRDIARIWPANGVRKGVRLLARSVTAAGPVDKRLHIWNPLAGSDSWEEPTSIDSQYRDDLSRRRPITRGVSAPDHRCAEVRRRADLRRRERPHSLL